MGKKGQIVKGLGSHGVSDRLGELTMGFLFCLGQGSKELALCKRSVIWTSSLLARR